MNIKKNILRVFSANLLTLISGILVGFVVPSVLSLDGYAYVKTYLLYAGYISILHFGFIDGMYIKYGGKVIGEIDKSILKAEHNIFNLIQVISTIIFILISFIKKDFLILVLVFSIIPINASNFHRSFYQATGQFQKYSDSLYVYTLIYLISNIFLALIFKCTDYKFYYFTSLIGYIISFLILEFRFWKDFREVKANYDKLILNNIKIGFIVLIANLGIAIFNATDLWFIKFLFNSNEFAYYSFAVSMLNIINVMIMAISVTFYNYLAREEKEELVKKLKIIFIIIGSFCSLSYFVFSMIVNIFLEKYIPSLSIIAISFATFPYLITIKGLFINIYKARKDEKKYLRVMLLMLVIAILYNLISIILFKSSEAIAFATLIAFITWYLYSANDFKYLNIDLKEFLYLIINTASFLILSNYFNWLIGGIIYLIIVLTISFIFYKSEILELINFKKLKLNRK